jgi:hypothetical protein
MFMVGAYRDKLGQVNFGHGTGPSPDQWWGSWFGWTYEP